MPEYSQTTLQLIGELLREAMVQDISWDRNLSTFKILFDCLRRNVDLTDLDDRTVEFNLSGVQAVSVGYDNALGEIRPSQFAPARGISASELCDWSFQVQEASLWINSGMNERGLESSILEWHVGDESAFRAADCTFTLLFEQWRDFGMPLLHIWLLVGGDTFAISSDGVPLEIEEWERQFSAWWAGWKKFACPRCMDFRRTRRPKQQERSDLFLAVAEERCAVAVSPGVPDDRAAYRTMDETSMLLSRPPQASRGPF